MLFMKNNKCSDFHNVLLNFEVMYVDIGHRHSVASSNNIFSAQ